MYICTYSFIIYHCKCLECTSILTFPLLSNICENKNGPGSQTESGDSQT